MRQTVLIALLSGCVVTCVILIYLRAEAGTSIRKLRREAISNEIGKLLSFKGLASELQDGKAESAIEALEFAMDTSICALRQKLKDSDAAMQLQIIQALQAIKNYRATQASGRYKTFEREGYLATAVEMRKRAKAILDELPPAK